MVKKIGRDTPVLTLLENTIDITREPFSDRGSPLLIWKQKGHARLDIKLARRFLNHREKIGAFANRPPVIEGMILINQEGESLDFTLTTSPHLLQFQTRIGLFQLCIQNGNTLCIGLPQGQRCGVRFKINPPLSLPSPNKSDQDNDPVLVWNSTGSSLTHHTSSKNGTSTISLLAPAGQDRALYLTLQNSPAQTPDPVPFSSSAAEAKLRWSGWFSALPRLQGQYRKQYYFAWWVLGNNLIDPDGSLPHPGVMPSKAKYIGIWNWDACFHALALRHVNPQLARDQLRIILSHQRKDGMLPDVVHQEGVVDSIDHPFPGDVTKPPVMAWTVALLHASHPDPSFLEEVYPHLVSWHEWWFSRPDQDGLAQYHHPYSSGLDDNPLWDDAFPVTSPDLNTYLVLQSESLAHIARELGREDEADHWMKKADTLAAAVVTHLYDPHKGFFQARSGQKPISAFTPFNLYPLWTHRLDEDIQHRLVAHLADEHTFWSPFPIPTVSMADPQYDPQTMWRGPVWINNNYMMIQALRRSDQGDMADQLREKTLHLVNRTPGIFEYYHPQTGAPCPGAAPIFGWSAALFIDLLLSPAGEPLAPGQG